MTEEPKTKVIREELIIKSKTGQPVMTFDSLASLKRWFEMRPTQRREHLKVFKRTTFEEPVEVEF